MKKGTKWLIGGGVLAAAYAVYKTMNIQKSIEFFQYSITGLKFKVSNILKPEVIFDISVYNPNKTAVPVTSFFGTIKSGATILANFNNVSAITVGGNQQSTISVSAKINALTVILKLISGSKITSVIVDGMLKTSLFDLPITKTVTLSSLSGTDDEIGMIRRQAARNRLKRQPKKGLRFLQYPHPKRALKIR
jgi:LEA14-like dessication related protein